MTPLDADAVAMCDTPVGDWFVAIGDEIEKQPVSRHALRTEYSGRTAAGHR
jgi:hypothetical protein